MEKIEVGSLKKDTPLSGLYFADTCFEGIPTELRIRLVDWHVVPQFSFDDSNTATPIPNSLGNITFKAYDEGLIKQVKGLKNAALEKSFFAGLGLLDFATVIPDDSTPEYQSLLKWVTKIETQAQTNTGKDLILSGAECHVYPVGLRGKGNFNKFQGVELRLCNPLKTKVSFADPVK